MSGIQNPAKVALRLKIKDILAGMTPQSRVEQSKAITEKISQSPAFKKAKRISIYLSMDGEVNTLDLIKLMFEQNKQVFVPTYAGKRMEMVKLNDWHDYESLPLTKWNIKQPNFNEGREDALKTGGLDLILMPGVAFTRAGGRMGHGMGYYDKYLARLFETYPERRKDSYQPGQIDEKLMANQTVLIALAFNEQIVPDNELPLESTDVMIDQILTA